MQCKSVKDEKCITLCEIEREIRLEEECVVKNDRQCVDVVEDECLNVKILAQTTAAVNQKVKRFRFKFKGNLVHHRRRCRSYQSNEEKRTGQPLHCKIQSISSERSYKTRRRDVYLVVGTDLDSHFVEVCKLINTISDKTTTMQPHNITYKVKQSRQPPREVHEDQPEQNLQL